MFLFLLPAKITSFLSVITYTSPHLKFPKRFLLFFAKLCILSQFSPPPSRGGPWSCTVSSVIYICNFFRCSDSDIATRIMLKHLIFLKTFSCLSLPAYLSLTFSPPPNSSKTHVCLSQHPQLPLTFLKIQFTFLPKCKI